MEGHDALIKARDINRVKDEGTDGRGNVASSNKVRPVLHESVFVYCRTVPIAADIMANKLHSVGTKEAFLE